MAKKKKDKIKTIQQSTLSENIVYNIKELLKNEKYDTKPNMAKFLKTYVKSIKIFISEARVNLWPRISYDIGKRLVYLKDNTLLIKDFSGVSACREFNDIKMTESLKSLLEKFFDYLEQFRFIRNGHDDVKVFSTDIEKTNADLSAEINCVKEKEVPQFIDYTPKIIVK